MISSADYQVAYTKLYAELRNYILDMLTAEALAEVEVATFDSFIDRDKLQKAFKKLNPLVRDIIKEFDDEDLKEALEDFKNLVEDDEDFYFDILNVNPIEEGE